MSPKSRGRPKGRGRKGKPRRAPAQDPLALLLGEASSLVQQDDALLAEAWASRWLGYAWSAALGDEDVDPLDGELDLVDALVERVLRHPSSAGLAALHALARVAPAEGTDLVAEAIDELPATLPAPAFATAPRAVPVRAWTAVDVWGAERLVFVEYDTPVVHTLVAQVLDVAGRYVETLALAVGPDVVPEWAGHRTDDDVPMEPVETPVDVALADLTDALAGTEVNSETFPDAEDYQDLRALAWSRAVEHAAEAAPPRPALSEDERERLGAAFLASGAVPDDETSAALVRLFLDFGEAYLPDGPLSWSPVAVVAFLGDALPGRVALEPAEERVLPDVLRAWLRFALAERGVPEPWVQPVLDAVDEGLKGDAGGGPPA